MLGDTKRLLEKLVEVTGGGAELGRGGIRLLYLAENLCLAQDHRVQPAGHPEQVAGTTRSVVVVKGRIHPGAVAKQCLQSAKGPNWAHARGIEFDAIAG